MSGIRDVREASLAMWLELSREDPRAGYYQSIAWTRATRSASSARTRPFALQFRFADGTIAVLPLPAPRWTPWCDPVASRALDADETDAIRRAADDDVAPPSPHGPLRHLSPCRAFQIPQTPWATAIPPHSTVDGHSYWQACRGQLPFDLLDRLYRLRDPGIELRLEVRDGLVTGGMATLRWNRVVSSWHRFGDAGFPKGFARLHAIGARWWDADRQDARVE